MKVVKKLALATTACAIVVAALAVQESSAAGVTAFTCVAGQGTLNADCEVGSSGTFGHVAISTGVSTGLNYTAKGSQVLSTILGGAEVTLTATELECVEECMAENKEVSATEMDWHATQRILFKATTVNVPNCTPQEPGKAAGTITTEKLTITMKSLSTMVIKPKVGTVFAKIHMMSAPGTTCPFAGQVFSIQGQAAGLRRGSIVQVNTAGGELTVEEEEAFLSGESTMTVGVTGGNFSPVAVTAT